MTQTALENGPVLSAIVVTDTLDRAATTLRSLAGQTVASELEVVIVADAAADDANLADLRKHVHSVVVIEVDSIIPLGEARAVGVRAARAPYVFLAETHAYPDPDVGESVVAALRGEWSAVVPGFRNGNPRGAISWAGYLSDYGAWDENLPAGEIPVMTSHNGAFRRDALLECGDRLGDCLNFGDELTIILRANGHRSYFEPAGGVQHVNIERFTSFLHERYLLGVVVGGYRCARWGRLRRLAYACGSPLIPIVLLSRIRKEVAEIMKRESLPASTVPAMVLGMVLKAAGEMRGYLIGVPRSADEYMTGLEIRKLAFNSGDEQ